MLGTACRASAPADRQLGEWCACVVHRRDARPPGGRPGHHLLSIAGELILEPAVETTRLRQTAGHIHFRSVPVALVPRSMPNMSAETKHKEEDRST
jgi:hypothetical protein